MQAAVGHERNFSLLQFMRSSNFLGQTQVYDRKIPVIYPERHSKQRGNVQSHLLSPPIDWQANNSKTSRWGHLPQKWLQLMVLQPLTLHGMDGNEMAS